PAVCIASSDKARRELGWKPEHTDLATIVGDAWQFHSSGRAHRPDDSHLAHPRPLKDLDGTSREFTKPGHGGGIRIAQRLGLRRRAWCRPRPPLSVVCGEDSS